VVAAIARPMKQRVAFLVGFTLGVMGIGLSGGPTAVTAMMTVATVLLVGVAVRALLRIWFPPDP
jgi:hypothetical protein